MCLAVPGQIVEISEENSLLMGVVDYGGTKNKVCLAYVPEARVGDYVIVHAGFALNLLNETEAARTLSLWEEYLASGQEVKKG